MTRGDLLIIGLLLTMALTGIALLATTPAGTRVIVTSGDQTCFVAELDQSHSVDLEGPLGKTHLVVDSKGVQITGSPCPRKICLSMGPARQTGDLLACVPNQILVRIENPAGHEALYDLLSR